jgi:ribosomal protein S18 acetylase RimI-like enzyme
LACFPVQYQESYYKDVQDSKGDGLCKFAYWNGFVVGAACARIEPLNKDDKNKDKDNDDNDDNKKQRIYIMTLGVLAAYRGRTIGAQLIQSILDHFENHMMDPELKNVVEITLHVQISNDDAIKFYTEKFGFEKGDIIENYYRRIDPPHCYKLYKKLR